MTLLNGMAMFAAFAVIVPVLLHLRKRRKSKVVDWPAMQFLKRTVTQRRRGLTLENLLLLLLRCLVVLLFVLAMARPAIESSRYFSWILFFLFAGSGLLFLTMAIVSNWQRLHRIVGVFAAALLFGIAGATLSLSPASLVDSEMDRDIAFVIDTSLTMTLGDDETSHFEKAIAEARSLVETLAGNSTVSIVLAGPIAETVDGSPFRNLRKAEQVLDTLSPVEGGSDLSSAIQQATSLLKRAPNSRKQLLLLSDDQLCTWESIEESRLAKQSPDTGAVTSQSRTKSKVIDDSEIDETEQSGKDSDAEIACAAIVAHLPRNATNISVDHLQTKSSLVTANRPVPIEVEIRNGGSTTIRDVAVNLLVDGRKAASESLIQIEPGVNSTVRFLHAFAKSGQHVVSGVVEIADQLPADNRIDSIVDVIPHLSILVVSGSTDADPAQQSATFAQLALDPTSLRQSKLGSDADEVNGNRKIIATVISASRLDEIESLANFQLVMLCDVPRLPVDAAERLASFVMDGGGLWVIPDEHAETSFYNNWRVPQTDQTIMPAQLGEPSEWSGHATANGRVLRLGVALDVAGRPFISDLFERGNHDLADVSIFGFWNLTPSEQALVGMRLTNGAVLFAEQSVGRGRVLTQSVSLARRDSTFPATIGFPVLMHLWTQHLAVAQAVASNVESTSDLVTDLTERLDPTSKIGTLQLREPSGTKREIAVSWTQDSPIARIGRAVNPGVYQLNNRNTDMTVASFAVHRAPEESDLSAVSEDRLSEISQELGINFIDDVSQLTSPNASESVGAEFWDTLLFIVLWLLAGECLVTKWIRSRRSLASIATSESNSPQVHQSPLPTFAFATAKESTPRWDDVPVNVAVSESVGAP